MTENETKIISEMAIEHTINGKKCRLCFEPGFPIGELHDAAHAIKVFIIQEMVKVSSQEKTHADVNKPPEGS